MNSITLIRQWTTLGPRLLVNQRFNALIFYRYSSTMRGDSQASGFTHLSADGQVPNMVNVAEKNATLRTATARSTIRLPPSVLEELKRMGKIANAGHKMNNDDTLLVGPKGPIGATAIIAGVLGAKQTSNLIPFCHPLPLEDCQIRIQSPSSDQIDIECQVRVTHKTGVEMEALTGASIAALCVYDMCKALSHDIVIEKTLLVEKTGGKSTFKRQ